MKETSDHRYIPMSSISSGTGHEVRSDVFYYTNQIVNVVMIGDRHTGPWVLVDTGMPKSGETIYEVCRQRFQDRKPSAIILTHGHFDHVGGVKYLASKWAVPVFAHPFEYPYLVGSESYPEPDPSVEGGLLAKVSSIYPNEPIDISDVLEPLSDNHLVPHVQGWRWIHVPGHCPGQVALYRDSDRTLISADALITVRQDSFYKVLLQKREINGPPRYFTTDWRAAGHSVEQLASLNPSLLVPGHGASMEGEELTSGLRDLADHFEERAVPDYGRYVPDTN